MDKLRLRFEKTGRAIYISHLDLMATMQRGFARAGLELKYSEGFNPHPLLSILLPLSVGTASVCELMDFRLRENAAAPVTPELLRELPARLTAALPEGIRVLEAYPAERKSAQLKWLDVEGRLEYDRGAPEPEALAAFFAQPALVIERKTKRGMGTADIRPAIARICFEAEAAGRGDADPARPGAAAGGEPRSESEGPEAAPGCIPDSGPEAILLRARISAQEPTLNPDHLISALRQLRPELKPDFGAFTRLETYDAGGTVFR